MTKASNALYCLILAGLKVSLGAFFLKIFSHKRLQTVTIHVLVGLTVVCAVIYFGFASFTCAQLKTPTIERGRCEWQGAYNIVFYIFSVLNIIGDFFLTSMGISALWVARLPVQTKVPACLLLSLGCMSAIAAIIRFILLVELSEERIFTRQSLAVGQWTLVEQGSGVVAANLLMLRPLMAVILHRIRGVSTAEHRGYETENLESRRLGLRIATKPQLEHTHGEAYLLRDITGETTPQTDEEKGHAEDTFSHASAPSRQSSRLYDATRHV